VKSSQESGGLVEVKAVNNEGELGDGIDIVTSGEN
jgi:hypothetical protein